MPTPVDTKLYEIIKKRIYKQNPVHSAYRSGKLVSEYKRSFSKKYGSRVSPYHGKKPKKSGLTRWFLENWTSDTGDNRYTSSDSVYRPQFRVTKDTPLTFSELTPSRLKKAKKEKKRTGRVKKF